MYKSNEQPCCLWRKPGRLGWNIWLEKHKVKFLMIVVSQLHVSQLQKVVSICIQHIFTLSTTANLLGAQIRVTEIWQRQKCDLYSLNDSFFTIIFFKTIWLIKPVQTYLYSSNMCQLSDMDIFSGGPAKQDSLQQKFASP